MKAVQYLKKFWEFLRKDTWQSLIVCLILAFLIIKFVFFPLLAFFTGTPLPLVIVESCSMHHSDGLGQVLANPIYNEYGIQPEDAENWRFKNGLSKGDIIFVVAPENLKIGDIIIFNGNEKYPIIHRVISLFPIKTKGDHNSALLPVETNIQESQIIGKAVFRIPLLGWAKLIFFEIFKNPSDRGLCV